MLEISNASKVFNKKTNNEIVALNKVNLTVSNGDFLILLGSNGSGKSTLLNSVAGSFFLDEGSIFINGIDVTGKRDFERSEYIARIFQNPTHGTAGELTIEENFLLASLRTSSKTIKTSLNNDFKDFVKQKVETLGLGLENKTSQPIGLLSGGQRQALTLLMATITLPKILLMDEPIAALDPKSADIVMRITKDIVAKNSITTILITHRIKDALDYGNRLVFMAQGKIEKDLTSLEKQKLQLSELINWF